MSQVQRVKVLRAFRHKGEDVGIGSVLTLDTPTAQELRAGRKVEFVAADTKGSVIPPEKKEKAPPLGATQLLELTEQVSNLTEQVSALAEIVEKLAAVVVPAKK